MQKRLVYVILSVMILVVVGCGNNRDLSDPANHVYLDTIMISPEEEYDYQPSPTKYHELLHTKLEVTPDWEKQHLFGKAHITLKPYFYPQTDVILDAKGFDIHKVMLMQDDSTYLPLDYNYDSLKLAIDLPRTYNWDETFTLFIDYTAKPNELETEGSAAITDEKGLYFINPLNDSTLGKPKQFWTQGEVQSSSCWFPTLDEPNQRTSQEIFITIDSTLSTLSNGKLVSTSFNGDGTKTDYWKQELPHTPYLFTLVAGDFAVYRDQWRGIDVDYYVDPPYAESAKAVFGKTPEMLEYFSDLLGVDYPWDKYSQVVVHDFVSGAMENTSASTYYGALHKSKQELIDHNYEAIIAHELFHQWFGDLVTCESWANLALNESFATYGEYLWFEYSEGKDKSDYVMLRNQMDYLRESRRKQEPIINFLYKDPDQLFDNHRYEKGAAILNMLHQYVGDQAFYASLNLYLTQRAFKSAEMHHVRLAFEEVTGEDLNWFFNQWFFTEGHPIIEVRQETLEDSVSLEITQRHSNELDFTYRLPIEVTIFSQDSGIVHELWLEEDFGRFKLPFQDSLQCIIIDPRNLLMAEITDLKSPDQYVFQYMNSPDMISRYRAVEYFLDQENPDQTAYEVLNMSLTDSSPYIKELVLTYIEDWDKIDNADEQLRYLFMNDDASRVRARAIDVLDELKAFNEENVMYALKDSSLNVMSMALFALADLNGDKAMEYAETHKDHTSRYMIESVANIYALHGDSSVNSYFKREIDIGSNRIKYDLLYYFGNYLGRMKASQADKELGYFADYARVSSSRFVRLAAKGGLKRIRSGFGSQKIEAQNELAQTDKVDLGKISELEDQIDQSNDIIDQIDALLEQLSLEQ